jgi:hypothetical protein
MATQLNGGEATFELTCEGTYTPATRQSLESDGTPNQGEEATMEDFKVLLVRDSENGQELLDITRFLSEEQYLQAHEAALESFEQDE